MRAVHLARERDRARAIAVALEQRLARVEALADEWQERADTSRAAAIAREGLSDAEALTDYSATMTRRSADVRAALEAPDA